MTTKELRLGNGRGTREYYEADHWSVDTGCVLRNSIVHGLIWIDRLRRESLGTRFLLVSADVLLLCRCDNIGDATRYP